MVQVFAVNTYSQSTRLSMNMKNVSIKTVLSQIEDKSQFYFIYDATVVDVEKKVSIESENDLITKILDELFEGTNVIYKINNRQIALATESSTMISQQQKSISGKVTDPSGSPVPGVSVVVIGTTTGSITDANGNYSISNIQENAILKFSFVGMKSQEILVGSKTNISVVLVEETVGIDEVVVVGYGTQKKANLTGAVGTVDAKALEARPITNVGQALQGLVPGLNIVQSGPHGGSLANRPSINIRGITTIGQGSSGSPLILIDGMEGDINALNPEDVDNISVLKDAAASSIYGSRAPFGVILVTTKNGKAGKTQINYSSSFRSTIPILVPKRMDSYTWALYVNDASRNAGTGDFFDEARMQRIKDYRDGILPSNETMGKNPTNPQYWDAWGNGNANQDWYKAYFKSSAPSQEHNLSFKGGNENVSYYLSGNLLDQDGLMKFGGDNFQRYTVTAKINANLTKWASLSYTLRFTREDYGRPSSLDPSNIGFGNGIPAQGWPIVALYDPNGYLFDSPSWALKQRDGGRYKGQDDWNYHQLNLTIEPIKGWKIFSVLNYKVENNFIHQDFQVCYNHDVNGNPYIDPYAQNSSVHEEAARTNYFSPNIYTEYAKSLRNHNLKLLLGFQSEENKYRSLSAERQGIITPSSPVLDITTGLDNSGAVVAPIIGGRYSDWAIAGYFGRFNYDYKGRYLFEANLRYDGTSRFRSTTRWKYFPSASVGWNIAQEEFWKPFENVVNTFKLRGSYGQLGNQNTSSLYPTYVTMPVGSANGSWLIGGIRPNTASAPGLVSSSTKWETVSTYNYGTDLGLFKNKLTASFDYFVRYTNDMIGPAPELPVILGTAVPRTNNTDLKTSGFELSVGWQDRLKNGFGYTAKLMLSDSRTTITNYPNPAGNLSTYRAGQEVGEIWGYTTIGIAKTQDEMDAHLASLPNGAQNALGSNWKAGDIMYKDMNDDGKINSGSNTIGDHGDLSIIGYNRPRYNFGVDLSADWKGFDIRAFFQGVIKRDFPITESNDAFWGVAGGIWGTTGYADQANYFRDDENHPLGINLDSYYPRPIFEPGVRRNYKTQTRYMQDASYIRLKNLQVGYTIPASITRKISVQKVRFYVSGENIWTKSGLSVDFYDPETIDGGSNGVVYPLSKVYSAGISVTL